MSPVPAHPCAAPGAKPAAWSCHAAVAWQQAPLSERRFGRRHTGGLPLTTMLLLQAIVGRALAALERLQRGDAFPLPASAAAASFSAALPHPEAGTLEADTRLVAAHVEVLLSGLR